MSEISDYDLTDTTSGTGRTEKTADACFLAQSFGKHVHHYPSRLEHKDFKESLAKHTDIFAFLDPPYPNLSTRLYGDSREYHEDFDHIGLNDILKRRKKWGCCYNDVPFVRDLYSDFQMIEVKRPGDSWGKNKDELLILSPDIIELLDYQQQYLFQGEHCERF